MVCGVIRVGERQQHAADVAAHGKHPFILPPRHHVTNLIVRRYHGMELSAILAFKLSFLELKVCKQLIAPLPKSRVSANNAPVTCTFIHGRGPAKEMYSNSSANFVLAERELKRNHAL